MSDSTSDPDAALTDEPSSEPAREPDREAPGPTERPFEVGDLVADREPTDGNANTAVVVNCPPVPAKEWTAYGDTTVAEDNPDHSEDASVIVVVYRSELDRYDPGWAVRDGLDPYPLTDFNEAGLSYYSFPATRLRSRDEEDITEATKGPKKQSGSNPDDSEPRMARVTHDLPATTQSRSQENTDEANEPKTEPDAAAEENVGDAVEPMDAALQLKDRLEGGGMTVEIEGDGRTLAAEKLGETYRVRPGGDVLEGNGLFAAKLKRIAAEFEP